MNQDLAERSLNRFLLRFALAYAGAVTLYMPLLSLLLPLAVAEVAGARRVALLATITIAGAVAASLSNILFGWLSDRERLRRGDRRRWMAAGLILTALSYAGIAVARSPTALLTAAIVFQVALNVLLAPLMASMADSVPDGSKGLAGGLLALAQPVAALVGAAVLLWPGAHDLQLAVVVAAGAALILPFLATAPPAEGGDRQPPPTPAAVPRARADLALIWLSRLLIQIAGNVLFVFLLFLLAGILRRPASAAFAATLGQVTAVAMLIALPIALLVGRLSDRARARKPALVATAVAAAAGLLTIAQAQGMAQAVTGYGLFLVASISFLGLQSAYAMQLLISPASRGRDLGLINLANTLPSILGPTLTWSLAQSGRYGTILAVLAALTLAAGLAIVPVRGR